MKKLKINNISKVQYSGYVYNLELESKEEEDDLFWVEQKTGVVTHNCFPKDVQSFVNWAESNNLNLDMCKAANEVNERVREVKDWLKIKGATTSYNYKKEDDIQEELRNGVK